MASSRESLLAAKETPRSTARAFTADESEELCDQQLAAKLWSLAKTLTSSGFPNLRAQAMQPLRCSSE